jgi:hypothetical protein
MSSQGGLNNCGMLFEWDPGNDQLVKKLDFDQSFGNSWFGSLTTGENGRIYGLTYNQTNTEILFEWDPINDSLNIMNDFTKLSALNFKLDQYPLINKGQIQTFFSSGLTEIKTDSYDTLVLQTCNYFDSPSGRYSWRSSGTYCDTIPNKAGFDSVITVNLTINNIDHSISQNEFVLTTNNNNAAYQWINCGGGNQPIEGEIRQSFSPITNGSYAVIVSQNGCIDTSECYEVNLTGLNYSNLKQNIILYRNPTDGNLTIYMGRDFPECEISIVQSDGMVIRKERFKNRNIIDLNLTSAPGLYMMIIHAGNIQVVFKILKK